MFKNNRSLFKFLVILVLASLFVAWAGIALADEGTPTEDALPVPSDGQSGTTLSADKTAEGFWKKLIEYDWSIQKTVDPTSIEIKPGGSGSVTYTITVTRTKVSEMDIFAVSGHICVTNGGAVATENLKLVDQVQYKVGAGQFMDLSGASKTITPAQLAAGASECYNYSVRFTPVENAIYRNTVKVTITNHSGHLGEEFGPEPKADFSLPAAPVIIETDAEADVSDVQTCPAGFTCTPSDSGPWHFTGSGSISFTKVIHNDSAPCDYYYTLLNTARLVESTKSTQRTSSASVQIYTGPCPSGCTLTIGYWKTHAGFTGNNADRVTPLLPVWLGLPVFPKSVNVTSATQAVGLLSMSGDASNGINKLYAQLLGTKLNIANGADGSAVSLIIANSDGFLSFFNAGDWSNLTKAQRTMVLGWMTTLDNYNNGLTGPGHCP